MVVIFLKKLLLVKVLVSKVYDFLKLQVCSDIIKVY